MDAAATRPTNSLLVMLMMTILNAVSTYVSDVDWYAELEQVSLQPKFIFICIINLYSVKSRSVDANWEASTQ